jgi:electron transfer flavoprotein beta subunit
MDIIVCIKQVPDPEAPPASFKVDEASNKMIPPPGITPVIDPYSEYAIEAALRIKESVGGCITAISLGSSLHQDILKKAVAMGTDELILLDDPAFEGGDSFSTAMGLAAAIKKIDHYDLVLCGRQAADWDDGQVGSIIAELLGIPCVTIAANIEVSNKKARVERVIGDGHEIIELDLPAVVTVSNELGEIRYPNIKGIMASKKKSATIWKPTDIVIDLDSIGENGSRLKLFKLYQPVREGHCEIIPGDAPEEMADNLISKLRAEKII